MSRCFKGRQLQYPWRKELGSFKKRFTARWAALFFFSQRLQSEDIFNLITDWLNWKKEKTKRTSSGLVTRWPEQEIAAVTVLFFEQNQWFSFIHLFMCYATCITEMCLSLLLFQLDVFFCCYFCYFSLSLSLLSKMNANHPVAACGVRSNPKSFSSSCLTSALAHFLPSFTEDIRWGNKH